MPPRETRPPSATVKGCSKGRCPSNRRAIRHMPSRTCGAVRSARRPVKAEVAGSNPVRSAARFESQPDDRIWPPGRVAQLVERAPEKREVRGSIPRPTTGKDPEQGIQAPRIQRSLIDEPGLVGPSATVAARPAPRVFRGEDAGRRSTKPHSGRTTALNWITGQNACPMSRPDTKYVAVGDADVAYQVLGEGPSDLLFFNGLGSHIEMAWEDPDIADFLRRLASLRRLIFLDRRGTGASDGVPRHAIPTWEEWTEDIESVLNAVGSEQTSILATVDAGPIAILYAASHPARVDSLVLCNTTARYLVADDYPIGFTPEALEFIIEVLRTHWGTPEFFSLAGAADHEDPVRRDALARLFRSSVTPRTAAAQYDYLLRNLDVRPVLPLLRVPTLVLSADNPSFLPMAHGRIWPSTLRDRSSSPFLATTC